MTTPDGARLLSLAESVADGSDVNWDAAEAAANADERAIVRQLRILANLATLHHSLPPAGGAAPGSAAPRTSKPSPAIGSWAHLSLVERLGGGTSGEVFRAWDGHLEREVALKLLRADEPTEDLDTSKVAREGRLLARVRHPNVITVYGVAVHEGRVGLWMELIGGTTLEQQLAKRGPFSAREAALVGIDLCRALAAIHAAGLIHRDVKTQNVMRDAGGRIVLMDLGTGREIGPRALPDLAGTPLYLAPEIFDGAAASAATDLYSLGVLLYRLVTGAFPVRATTIQELTQAHDTGASIRLRDARADLPTAFVRVVDRCIAKDPARRYASAGALEADLAHALNEGTAPRRPAIWRRAGWQTFAGLLLLIMTVGLVALPGLRSKVKAPENAPASAPAATPAARIKMGVLPLENLTGRTDLAHWPRLVQALLADELTGADRVAVMDPLSLNSMFENGLKNAAPQLDRRFFDQLKRSNVNLVVSGTILTAGGGYELRINLVDPVTGETKFPAQASVSGEEALAEGIRGIAGRILGFLQVQPLADDKDLRPAYSLRRHDIRAVNAFLEAAQYTYNNDHGAANAPLRRAIAIDPTFVAPRIWLIPGLVFRGEIAEAKDQYAALLKLEPGVSPLEHALIAYAGAILAHDAAGVARSLELSLQYAPGNNILLLNLADIRAMTGDCVRALDALEPVVAMKWRYPPAYAIWGACSIQTDRLADARRVLADALTLPRVYPSVYGFLQALALADGNAAAAKSYGASFEARAGELDQRDMSDVARAFERLSAAARRAAQPDRAAALQQRSDWVKAHSRSKH